MLLSRGKCAFWCLPIRDDEDLGSVWEPHGRGHNVR
jgi:hypothetical protein